MTELEKIKEEKRNSMHFEVKIDPHLKLLSEGYTIFPKPTNWLAKLLWRWLKVEVKVEYSVNLCSLIPRVKPPKFIENIGDIE